MHRIRRLRFEVDCTDEQWALNFRQHFGASVQRQLVDAIDAACSEAAGEDDLIVIDRLELDLGLLRPEVVSRDLAVLVRERLRSELRRIGQSNAAASKQAHSDTEIVLYFFLHGVLPWWAESATTHVGEIIARLDDAEFGLLRSMILANVHDDVLWRRIALQTSLEAAQKILELFDPLAAGAQHLGDWAAKLRAGDARFPDPDSLGPAIVRAVISSGGKLLTLSNGTGVLAGILQSVVADAVAASDGLPIEIVSLVIKQVTGVTEPIEPPADTAPGMEEFEDQTDSETITTCSAGLVILTPYISRFFEQCSLTHENSFLSKHEQHVGVHLLGYAATGRTGLPEHALALEKIICGLDVREPIPREIELTDAQRTECDTLLRDVIENWPALKNTSVNGLREAFLQREGLLSRNDRGWLLRIERRAYDVLLDRLPWGFERMMLPWNTDLIKVVW